MTALTLGEEVYNSKMNLVGFIDDIFGSVKSPYISIKLKQRNESPPFNKALYAMNEKPGE